MLNFLVKDYLYLIVIFLLNVYIFSLLHSTILGRIDEESILRNIVFSLYKDGRKKMVIPNRPYGPVRPPGDVSIANQWLSQQGRHQRDITLQPIRTLRGSKEYRKLKLSCEDVW